MGHTSLEAPEIGAKLRRHIQPSTLPKLALAAGSVGAIAAFGSIMASSHALQAPLERSMVGQRIGAFDGQAGTPYAVVLRAYGVRDKTALRADVAVRITRQADASAPDTTPVRLETTLTKRDASGGDLASASRELGRFTPSETAIYHATLERMDLDSDQPRYQLAVAPTQPDQAPFQTGHFALIASCALMAAGLGGLYWRRPSRARA